MLDIKSWNHISHITEWQDTSFVVKETLLSFCPAVCRTECIVLTDPVYATNVVLEAVRAI